MTLSYYLSYGQWIVTVHVYKYLVIYDDLVVEVDLAAPYFVPGKKLYERVRWCLKDKHHLAFKFLMSWTSEGKPI